jgi:molybdenum cofactor synthesis domain-containing protein
VRGRLVSFDRALGKILKAVPKPKRESVALAEALGRVLGQDVRADRDLPPFDRAALDGYAVRVEGLFGARRTLPITGEIVAGEPGRREIKPNSCVRIWTGASVPKGAQGIIPVERARERGGEVTLEGPLRSSGMRRYGIADRGEDASRGELLLPTGETLGEGDLVVLGAVGRSRVSVYREPRIAVLVTGHELVRPHERPTAVQIRSTNDLIVSSLVAPLAAPEIETLGIVGDERGPLRRAIRRGLESDLLIVTGGVSMGRLDLVPEILESLGVRIELHGIAIRPGKPFLFGRYNRDGRRTAVFGLPGNPVSVMVTTLVLVAPYLHAWRGAPSGVDRSCAARLLGSVVRGGNLLHFVPCRLGIDRTARATARPLPMNGSGDFVSASRANGLLRVPGDGRKRRAGSIMTADPIPGTAWLGVKR